MEHNIKNRIKRRFISEEKNLKDIWMRTKTRDFSGNIGLAIKNSTYQLSTDIISKIGSLIFTVIIARLLMPELFGLYSIALSTILLFSVISELGIGSALIRYISIELSKGNKGNVKSYIIYLGKIKIYFMLVAVILLLVFAKFISETYYQKPVFLALLAGVFYIIFFQITNFLQAILMATNYFKGIFYKEIILQISKIILVPLAIIISLNQILSNQISLFLIILCLSVSYLFSALFLGLIVMKRKKMYKGSIKVFSKTKKKKVNKFLLPLYITAFSGIFFSYIDRIMLGHFVIAEFIGYYSAALSLIGALIPLVAFSSIILLPIFSRLKGKRLKKALQKSIGVTVLFSFIIAFLSFMLASPLIQIVYGKDYLLSIGILKLFSFLLIIIPIGGLYQSYFISKGDTKKMAVLLIVSTIINLILNYFFITTLLSYGNLAAVYGAGVATLFSQIFYVVGLIFFIKKSSKKSS